MILRILAGALLCVLISTVANACDAMRPCYGNGRLIYGSPRAYVDFSYRQVGRKNRHRLSVAAQDSFSGHRAIRHRTARRAPDGLARVMAEGAGRAAGLIRSTTGATAHVAARATGAFQCLVDRLDRQGYPIRFMGGWRRHGSVRASLHPAGLALDINQLSRNVTRPHMPGNEIALANACGLISGRQWANGDSGHFQLGGWAGDGVRYASGRRRYARTH